MDHKARTDDKGQAPAYSDSTLPPPASKPAAPSTGPPAPDYNTPRILHIYRDGLTHRHMTITDMDKTHPLYQMDQNSGSAFSSKPHMTISQPSSRPGGAGGGGTPAVVGTATFHTWSRTIDLDLHGRPVPFESEGFFTRAYAYASPAFGERLRWECDGVWGADLVLVNARKEWIARFDASLFSMTKTGKIHVVHGGITGAALDEIVVSGCAMMQHERRRRANSGGGGDAAGAAAGDGGGGGGG